MPSGQRAVLPLAQIRLGQHQDHVAALGPDDSGAGLAGPLPRWASGAVLWPNGISKPSPWSRLSFRIVNVVGNPPS
jgi:hypothetical protein